MELNTTYGKIEEEVFQELMKGKTKKQFHNALRVLYGKKKDRGHLKQKYNQLLKEKRKYYSLILTTLEKYFKYFK